MKELHLILGAVPSVSPSKFVVCVGVTTRHSLQPLVSVGASPDEPYRVLEPHAARALAALLFEAAKQAEYHARQQAGKAGGP